MRTAAIESKGTATGRWARLAWAGALACTLAFTAGAQDGPPPGGPGGGGGGGRGGGPQLSAEEREAAWTLQANGVAAELGLSEELAVKLSEAYITSRENLQSTLQEARGGGGGGGGNRMEEMLKIQEDERAILKADIATFLSAEQADKAIVPLGTFNRQWDGYVNTLAKFGLDAEKQNKGLSLIAAFVVESTAAQAEAMAAGDFQSIRAKMMESKTKLDTAMGEILDADQLNSWKAATAMRQGGGRPGGGGNRPGGGAGGGGGPGGGGPGGN